MHWCTFLCRAEPEGWVLFLYWLKGSQCGSRDPHVTPERGRRSDLEDSVVGFCLLRLFKLPACAYILLIWESDAKDEEHSVLDPH